MSKLSSAIFNIRLLDDMAKKDTSIHKLHPLTKLITTVIYLLVVISFGSYEISGLIAFIFYPIMIFTVADLAFGPILKRVLLVEPLIIGIGILNPLFDSNRILVGEFIISRGWITFLSIIIKSSLTVTVSILLIATTGMNQLAYALRKLKIPRLFVLQLLLTYRYISVLIEEVSRMLRAYFLRAPKQKGIQANAWGSFAGQLILRTYERAQRIYISMNLRGFHGDYYTKDSAKFCLSDLIYLFGWSIFFIIARVINIPLLLGTLLSGVIK